jgi:hypothetical protein
VDDRLECDCLVLVAARVEDDAGDVLRSQHDSDFASEREIQNSEVSFWPVKGSRLLAVSDLLTASNLPSCLTLMKVRSGKDSVRVTPETDEANIVGRMAEP